MRRIFHPLVLLALTLPLSALPEQTSSSRHDKIFSVADLRGGYGFSFAGEIVGIGPVAASGVVISDGRGNVNEAVRTISVGGVIRRETFTCTLTVNPDGTGAARCPLDAPAPGAPAVETFDFVIADKSREFRFVATTPGFIVAGIGRKQ